MISLEPRMSRLARRLLAVTIAMCVALVTSGLGASVAQASTAVELTHAYVAASGQDDTAPHWGECAGQVFEDLQASESEDSEEYAHSVALSVGVVLAPFQRTSGPLQHLQHVWVGKQLTSSGRPRGPPSAGVAL